MSPSHFYKSFLCVFRVTPSQFFRPFLSTFSSQSLLFFESELPIFWVSPSHFSKSVLPFLSKALPFFRVSPSHFSEPDFSFCESDLSIFSGQSSHFFKLDLPIFWVRPFRSFGSVLPTVLRQTFPFFGVSPSHFFDSDLPILFSKLLFNYFELILRLMCLIRRCLTWDVNRKYIFQWRYWFRGDSNKLFLCRVYVHWNFRIFNCVIWTPN